MRMGLLAAATILCLGTPSLMGQTPDGRPAPKVSLGFSDQPRTIDAPPVIELRREPAGNADRTWGRGEYLLWWVRNTPMPLPIVTTGNPADGFPLVNSAGAIGRPGTRTLFGESTVGFGAFSGMRLTVGHWLGNDRVIGFEATGFSLERRTNQFAAASDGVGNPPLYFPAANAAAGGAERALAIADPLRLFSGDVFATSSLRLWGTELNGVLNLQRRPGMELSALVGFRYADLRETFGIHNTTNDLLFRNTDVANDLFATRNQFYGGQLGARFSWQREKLSVDVTTKVALGATHQVVNVEGNITRTGPGGVQGPFNGGVFAQPSNIGGRSGDSFSVLPAIEMKFAYQISPRVRAVLGYDFMYWSQVVRPGAQIDHNINPTQSPIFGAGVLTGPAAPAPLFARSDFWAHGINVGLEFRF